jgi:hypothetical protein
MTPAKKKEPTQDELAELSNTTTTAIAKRTELAIEDMPITWKMIETMSQSLSVPTRYHGKPGDILTTMKMGLELGISPLEALNEIYIVNGKPSSSGKLLAALIWRAGHIIICTPGVEGAEVKTWRKINGEYHAMPVVTFTKEDAERAGLMDKDTYKQYPQAMMSWRAITLAARLHFPDVVSSIGYTQEEAGLEDVELIEANKNVVEILDAEVVYDSLPPGVGE